MPRSECASCKITFSSVSAFDKHLRWRDGMLKHVDPAEIPELWLKNGIWTGSLRGPSPWLPSPEDHSEPESGLKSPGHNLMRVPLKCASEPLRGGSWSSRRWGTCKASPDAVSAQDGRAGGAIT